MKDTDEILNKISQAKRREFECLKADLSTSIQICLWVGGENLSDDPNCRIKDDETVTLYISAINDSIYESDILYESECFNKVLCFLANNGFNITEILPTIACEDRARGSQEIATYHNWEIKFNKKSSLFQEIIQTDFLVDPQIRKQNAIGPVKIPISVIH